jgi:ATP-dependent exoDNAse (exonuclease V) alpha subunit
LAIYHLRVKLVSRALGRAARPGGATRRSVVGAAAYRSGEPLFDSSQGKWFAFDKPDVTWTELIFPNGEAPVWDRQTLWNMVERAEKRADAQLAREVEITLPRELTKEQHIELVRSFVHENYVRKGMVADIAIHNPSASDGEEQPHAHVLLTMRRLDPTSATGFSPLKERSWNEPEAIAKAVAQARKRFNDTGLPEDKAALDAAEAQRNVNVWRREWASYTNRSLEAIGSAARIDHRTLEAQGIKRPPQPHLGLSRHIEKAYAYLKDRLTHWVAVRKRSQIYQEIEQYQMRNPVKLAEFILRLTDMAEDVASHYRHSTPIPEVPLER